MNILLNRLTLKCGFCYSRNYTTTPAQANLDSVLRCTECGIPMARACKVFKSFTHSPLQWVILERARCDEYGILRTHKAEIMVNHI